MPLSWVTFKMDPGRREEMAYDWLFSALDECSEELEEEIPGYAEADGVDVRCLAKKLEIMLQDFLAEACGD